MSHEASSPQPYGDEESNANEHHTHNHEQAGHLLQDAQEAEQIAEHAHSSGRTSEDDPQQPSLSPPDLEQAQFASFKEESRLSGLGSQRPGIDTRPVMVQWWQELCAILASVAFLIAVYAVLLRIHNTQLRDWSMPFDMQPTALIAVLTTLSRIFLVAVLAEALSQLKWIYLERRPHKLEDIEIFDSASRGAFGSVVFLGNVHRQAIAASFGAIITILVLAMEPFAQQALSFHSEPLPHSHHKASIPLATSYDWNTAEITDPLGALGGALDSFTNAQVIAPMFDGLYNPSNTVNTICPSGNCTWPSFDTLGICTSCEDISASMKRECKQVLRGSENYWERTECNYTTPDGVILPFHCRNEGSNDFSTLWVSTGNSSEYYDPQWDYPLPRIVRISSLWIDTSSRIELLCAPGTGWEQARHVATQCTFSWCIKRLKANVTNGNLVEEELSSTDVSFAKNCPSDDFGVRSGVVTNMDTCAKGWWRNLFTFWINPLDSDNIFGELNEIFTQTVASNTYSFLGRMLYTVNERNLTKDAVGVANALTNMIRQGPNTTSWEGTVLSNEIVIKVNWFWLIYPSAVVLLTLAFFIITISRSAKGSRMVWKSSSLAMMFHGITGWNNDLSLQTTSEMKQAAKQLKVRLAEDQTGSLRLVGG